MFSHANHRPSPPMLCDFVQDVSSLPDRLVAMSYSGGGGGNGGSSGNGTSYYYAPEAYYGPDTSKDELLVELKQMSGDGPKPKSTSSRSRSKGSK